MTQTAEILEALPPAQMQPTGLAQFDLTVTATPLVITWDKAAVMAMLNSVLAQYEGLVVREENVPAIKSEMAGLNKLAERFDTARKDIKRQVGAPLAVFDEDVKDVTSRIIEVREGLNRQVKAFERRDREGRRQNVQFVIDGLKNSEGVLELDISIRNRGSTRASSRPNCTPKSRTSSSSTSRTRPPPNSLNGPRPTALRWLKPR